MQNMIIKKGRMQNRKTMIYEFVLEGKFTKDLDKSDVCELRKRWDDINIAMQQSKFWLFDER